MPEVRDSFMTAVSVGRIVSRHSNRREEGTGSTSQVFGADFFKISRTVFFRDRHEKQQRHANEGFA